MSPKFVLLASDVVVWGFVVGLVAAVVRARRSAEARRAWRAVFADAAALCAAVVLAAMGLVAVLDSVHFRRNLPATAADDAQPAYATRTESLLDLLLAGPRDGREISYSAPLAMRAMERTMETVGGRLQAVHPRLAYAGAALRSDDERPRDLAWRTAAGLAAGMAVALAAAAAMAAVLARVTGTSWRGACRRLLHDRTRLPWRAALVTLTTLCLVIGPAAVLAAGWHVFGTDRTGNDVLYQALKSLRTAFVIGCLPTVATLPLAAALGLAAGYWRGWVDEVVTYVYTVLSSIPNVLLIAACVLMLQVALDAHPDWFETGSERADARLAVLCLILGLTTWATLCRLLRAETIKLCTLDFVQAAQVGGLSPLRILHRHLLPNVAHLILITTVLDFSSLVLYEAVLSYVGVGVDPAMHSYGGMINLTRFEMSREPLVWWSFAAAFGFMVTLVLAANLLADGVRNAFDPGAGRVFGRRSALRRRVARAR